MLWVNKTYIFIPSIATGQQNPVHTFIQNSNNLLLKDTELCAAILEQEEECNNSHLSLSKLGDKCFGDFENGGRIVLL